MIEVAPFSPGYAKGVAALIIPIQREEFGIPITLGDQPDLADIPGFYQRGTGNFWIALYGGEVVGSIALLDIGNAQGALRKMFVAPNYRGREFGTAKRLLDTLIDRGRAHQLQDIFLGTTAKFLAAHRFYEKNGFSEVSRTELPASFPIMGVDTKFYRCSLT
jgi:GNAT superfamily N-acetyltransferase